MDIPNHQASQSPPNDQRLPVPHYMRTRRVAPRVLASILTITWFACFTYGSMALAKIESRRANNLEQPLHLGETFWALRNSLRSDRCAGYLRAKLTRQQLPGRHSAHQVTLKLDGTMRIALHDKVVHAKANALGLFDDQLELRSLHATVEMNEGAVTFSLPKTKEEFSAQLTVGDFSRTVNFGSLGPIYLVQQSADLFRLRLPKTLQSFLQERDKNLPNAPVEMIVLEEDKITGCQAEAVSDSGDHTLVDLGDYLSLLPFATRSNEIVTDQTSNNANTHTENQHSREQ